MKTAKKIKCLTFYIKFFHTFERITLNETYWHNFFIIHVCQLSLFQMIGSGERYHEELSFH